MWSEESEFNWKDLCDLLCLCEHHGGITEQWHVTDIKAGPTFTALNRRIHLVCRHRNQCLSTSFSLISYSTNYIRLKKHEKHIASHFWKSYSLTFWATEKSPERTSFSLIWRRTTSDKHPGRNISLVRSYSNTSTVHCWPANILQQGPLHTNVRLILGVFCSK